MLTLPEAAATLRCHPNTVRAWVRQGKLIPVPMGEEQVNMFRKADVERLKKPLEQVGVIVKDDRHAFPVVGIGASAGGLDAISRLLQALPTDLGLAYVFVSHVEKDQEKTLADVLRKRTSMPVIVVENGMRLDPDRLYVNPSGMHASVVNGTFTLQVPRGTNGLAHRPIDSFFTALANEYQNNAIGIVLSGGGMDGTEGLRAIKAEDGLTIAQDASAQDQGMPQSAQEAEVVDLIRAPEDIARDLVDLVKELFPGGKARIPSKHENELRRILQYLLEQRGVDFSEYKEATIHRRIIRRMVLSKCRKLSDYAALLRGIPSEVDTLYNDLLINVTSFFRDPAFHRALTERVFPELLTERSGAEPLRIWVPACAGGEEVVSIAITLLEFLGERSITVPVQVFATDLNERTIERARLGIYKKSALQDIGAARLSKYFTHVDGHYQVIKPIRDMCVFAKHDLLKDPPFSRIDLISCQNVLIYLEPAAQGRILKSFHYALQPTGRLVLGRSETPGNAGDIFVQPEREHKVYRPKRKGRQPLGLDLPFKPTVVSMPASGTPVATLRVKNPRADIDREVEQLLLRRYVPPSVLVNKDLEVVRFMGATGPFLGPTTGRASLNLLKLVRDDLAFELRALFHKARKEKIVVRKSGVPVRSASGLQEVALEVLPVGDALEQHFLVVFKEAEGVPDNAVARRNTSSKGPVDARDKRIALLEQELRDALEQVRLISEESEITLQELQASNEEVVSSNEELQSINEELETSKEELQSINEEFATINEELQQRNDSLRESQERLEIATRTGKVGIWDWDVVADRITWSESHYAIHGVTPGTFEPTVKGFSDLVHPDDRGRVGQAIEAALKHDARYELEFRSVRPDGTVLWLFTNATVIRANGRPVRMLGATLDITDLKLAEQALRMRTRSLELMNAMGDTLIAELDTQKIVQAVTDTGREIAGAEFGAFFHNVTNAEGKSYMLYTLSGLPREAFAHFPMPRATDLFGPTFRGEGTMRIDDVRKDPRYGHMPPYHGMPKGHPDVRSYLAVPVTSRDGKVLGGLFFGHPEPGRFTQEAEEMVTTLAAQAAMAIDNADLHAAVQRELQQQQLSAAALSESEARYRKLIETLPAAVFTCDAEGRILIFNEACVALWGVAPESRSGEWHGAYKLFTAAGEPIAKDASPMARAIREGRSVREEVIVERKDGSRRNALVHPEPLFDSAGKVIGGYNVLVDITDLKENQRALTLSEERFKAVFEHSPFGIVLTDADTRLVDVNPAYSAMVGMSRTELIGKTSVEVGLVKDTKARKAILEGLHSSGHTRNAEMELTRPDGSKLLVRSNAEIVPLGSERFIISMVEDITERKAERAAQRQLAAIVESSDDAIISKDLDGSLTSWNKGAELMFGYTASEIIGKPNTVLFPDDRHAEEKELFERLKKGERIEHYETVRLRKDGSPVEVALTLSPLKNERGEIIGASKTIRDITESKRAREAVRESEERFHLLADNVKQLIWMAEADGSAMWFNQRWFEFTGMTGEQIRMDAKSLHHPDHYDRVTSSLRERAANGQPWEETFPLKGKDGEYRWFLATAMPVHNAGGQVARWFGTCTDITTAREAQALIYENEERFRMLADNMSQMAYVADAGGRITWVNRRWTDYTGMGVEEMNDGGWGKAVDPVHFDDMVASYATAQQKGEPWEYVFRVRSTTGEYRWFLSRSIPIHGEDGKVERWFGTNTDITEQKLAEEALEESSRHKDHFLATLAHELRNPLAPLKNGLQLMELMPDDTKTLESTRAMMVRQLDHMVRLVDDLMDLSRINRGMIHLARQDLSLTEVLGTALEASKPLIERNEHRLSLDVSQEGLMVHGDLERLTQVVANLLNNAAKYTPRGGHIELSLRRENEHAVIRVTDNGIGIDPSVLPKVFDMFAQVDPDQKTQAGGGLGIGLNVVQRLVRMHGGEVEGRSEGLDMGSTFIVRLPLIAATEKNPVETPVPDRGPGPSRRVLIVDDNEDAALSMSMILKKRGHDVRVAHDGEQGLATAESFKPEVVFMDIGMPKMNGYEACASMRATAWGRAMHIVALSGWGQEEDRRRSEEAGFDRHIVKPIDRATLERMIAEAPPGNR